MIIFRSVTKDFPGSGFRLEDISFHINSGEMVILVGHSGSGKTTLMKLLTREYEVSQGEIEFDGVDITSLKAAEVPYIRRRIGVVFQDYKLLPELNVWENIALPLSIVGKSEAEIESRVTDLLKLIELTDRAFLFPSQLSGGEAQRVSIARALATGPQVLFADEPTGNLDAETSLIITRLLSRINQLGTTLIMATHDSDVLKALADHRHLHMEKGRLVKDTHPKTPELKVADTKTSTIAPEPVPTATESVTSEPVVAEETVEAMEAVEPSTGPRFKLSMPKLSWPFGKKIPSLETTEPADKTQNDNNETEDETKDTLTVKVETL